MKYDTQPFVSIITPVYNGELYLKDCIEAVLAQTYRNFEYIIVNNCSTDSSLIIAEKYAAMDTKVCVINNDNFVGVIENHNISLQHVSSQSKYIKFAHADDLLFPECIERMVEMAEKFPSVGIVSGHRLKMDRIDFHGIPYTNSFMPGKEVGRKALLGELFVFGSFNSTLIRTDIVRMKRPFYDESNLHADTEACYEILKNHDLGFVHQILTFTRRHRESVTDRLCRNNKTSILDGGLALLMKYGPIFLTESEFSNRKSDLLRDYYGLLGRMVIKSPGREFWTYHLNGHKKHGIRISKLRICFSTFKEIIVLLANWPRMKRVVKAFLEHR